MLAVCAGACVACSFLRRVQPRTLYMCTGTHAGDNIDIMTTFGSCVLHAWQENSLSLRVIAG
jgi:hypothetical protein